MSGDAIFHKKRESSCKKTKKKKLKKGSISKTCFLLMQQVTNIADIINNGSYFTTSELCTATVINISGGNCLCFI